MNNGKTDRLGHRMKTLSIELKLYMEKRLELLLLNIGEHVASWMSKSIQRVLGFVVASVGILFLLVALAIFLGEWIGIRSLGYVIVGLPLLIGGGVMLTLKSSSLTTKIQGQFEAEIMDAINSDGRQLTSPNEHMEQEEPTPRT